MSIISNKIKCKLCQDVIESKHRHDFKMCSCGKVGVDGGLDYFKRVGLPEYIDDMSIIEDSDEEINDV